MSDPIDILGVAIERLERLHDQWKALLIMQAALGPAIETQGALANLGMARADVDAVHDLIIDLRNACL